MLAWLFCRYKRYLRHSTILATFICMLVFKIVFQCLDEFAYKRNNMPNEEIPAAYRLTRIISGRLYLDGATIFFAHLLKLKRIDVYLSFNQQTQ